MTTIHPGKLGDHPPAVPARDPFGARLPLDVVQGYMARALQYAAERPDRLFHVQRDGWGYPVQEFRSVMKQAPDNIMVPWDLKNA